MHKRLLLNLLMLISAAALAWVAIYKPGQAPAPPATALTTLTRDEVERIVILRAADQLELTRRGERWVLLGDPELPADQAQVDALLQLVSLQPQHSYAAAELDLAQLELDPPTVRLRLNDTQLAFGGTEALDNLRYVQVDDRVHLINDSYHNILQGKRTQLVSRRLLPATANIQALHLPDLTLVKQATGDWSATPEPDAVSADAIPQLLQAWQSANAFWVRDYRPQGDSKPIRVELSDGQSIRFELRLSEHELQLARPDWGIQYQLPAASAARLLQLPTASTPATPATQSSD